MWAAVRLPQTNRLLAGHALPRARVTLLQLAALLARVHAPRSVVLVFRSLVRLRTPQLGISLIVVVVVVVVALVGIVVIVIVVVVVVLVVGGCSVALGPLETTAASEAADRGLGRRWPLPLLAAKGVGRVARRRAGGAPRRIARRTRVLRRTRSGLYPELIIAIRLAAGLGCRHASGRRAPRHRPLPFWKI